MVADVSLLAEPINWVATSAFGLLCLLVGGLIASALLLNRRSGHVGAKLGEAPLDEATSAYVDGVARDWAQRTGKTDAHADIAGSYAKLALRIQQRGVGGRR